jgi:DNA adenine methylase
MKTPLRYPGGKSRAIDTLMEFVPDDCGELCSPFLGGGSFELALAERGIVIHGYEGFKPIVWFWNALLKKPQQLAVAARRFRRLQLYSYDKTRDPFRARGLRKDDFLRFKEEIAFALKKGHPGTIDLAAKVYALNRSSFSGTTLTGGYSAEASCMRFTESQLDEISNFKVQNFTVRCADFKRALKNHDCYLYLDPPYFMPPGSNNYYGMSGDMHKSFEHLALFSLLRQRENWILSYRDCDEIRSLYRDYQIYDAQWTYGMNKTKESKEIIITNLPKRLHCVIMDNTGGTE